VSRSNPRITSALSVSKQSVRSGVPLNGGVLRDACPVYLGHMPVRNERHNNDHRWSPTREAYTGRCQWCHCQQSLLTNWQHQDDVDSENVVSHSPMMTSQTTDCLGQSKEVQRLHTAGTRHQLFLNNIHREIYPVYRWDGWMCAWDMSYMINKLSYNKYRSQLVPM